MEGGGGGGEGRGEQVAWVQAARSPGGHRRCLLLILLRAGVGRGRFRNHGREQGVDVDFGDLGGAGHQGRLHHSLNAGGLEGWEGAGEDQLGCAGGEGRPVVELLPR